MLQLLENATSVLLGTTATVAVAHALLGIDHSLPFIALARARRWTLRRTVASTPSLRHSASSSSHFDSGTLSTIRSWASEIQISVYDSPSYFSGARSSQGLVAKKSSGRAPRTRSRTTTTAPVPWRSATVATLA